MLRRLCVASILVVGFLVAGAGQALAHGIRGRADLPVPVSFFATGAGLALVISFVALSTLWPEPRLQNVRRGRTLGGRGVRAAIRILPTTGLVVFAIVVLAGFFEGTGGIHNIAPVIVWVGFWLVVPFLSAVAGDLWQRLSPFRTAGRLVNGGRPERPELVDTLGMWPAVAALVAFTWLELVYPHSADARVVATAALIYLAWVVGMTRWAGVESGLEIGGAFHHYNRLISSISPVAWVRPEGVGTAIVTDAPDLVYRGWLRALPQTPQRRGLAAFVIAMIGTVTYDGLSSTKWWDDLWGTAAGTSWFETLALLSVVVLLYTAYMGASHYAARLADSDRSAMDVAASFAHTLVPIALAYAFAHYFTLVIFEGQQLIHAASDPFGLGWDLFGTAEWRVRFWLAPLAVWYIQVITIIAGHIAGVVLAHDRSLVEFGSGRIALRSQYAMLVLMVSLTSLGLFVLAG